MSEEISSLDRGHIVKNGKKKEPENIGVKDLWKKLQFLQEKLLEMENRQKQVEKAVIPEGGLQPKSKGIKLVEEEEGKKDLTDLGGDIYKHVLSNDRLTRKDLDEILSDHGKTRSKQTHLTYLQKIPSKLNPYLENADVKLEHKSGSRGGRGGGTPSRVVAIDQ